MYLYTSLELNCDMSKTYLTGYEALYNCCTSYNLTQLITGPTRVTESSSSILVLILASDVRKVQKTGVLLSAISDRELIYLITERTAYGLDG